MWLGTVHGLDVKPGVVEFTTIVRETGVFPTHSPPNVFLVDVPIDQQVDDRGSVEVLHLPTEWPQR